MNNQQLQNELILAWVRLSGIIKNNRITTTLKYNEAIVMLTVYSRYLKDGVGLTSVQDIIKETGMLKSLVNRTLGKLESQGLIVFEKGTVDRRTKFVKCVKEKLEVFLSVHNTSLGVSQNIIDIIGSEDAKAFINIVEKLASADYKAQPKR
ncbi:MAG: MarR family transcriptional regulator [Clostridia bacterium]|nr:MarR family transcriptional regulator [Clostridia bacterium]MBR4116833.1 MarR family transcriptional regulator [Clostridia bacterium]